MAGRVQDRLDRFFAIKAQGSTVRTECAAGRGRRQAKSRGSNPGREAIGRNASKG